jgi:hypothetical protein
MYGSRNALAASAVCLGEAITCRSAIVMSWRSHSAADDSWSVPQKRELRVRRCHKTSLRCDATVSRNRFMYVAVYCFAEVAVSVPRSRVRSLAPRQDHSMLMIAPCYNLPQPVRVACRPVHLLSLDVVPPTCFVIREVCTMTQTDFRVHLLCVRVR